MKVTKLVLWITALALIVALGFSVVCIAVSRKGVTGPTASGNVRYETLYTDGLPDVDFFKYEAKIEKAGKYRVTFEPSLKSESFVLGCEAYDSDGKILAASVLFDGEAVKNTYEFKEGTCAFHFRHITSEQDLRDYIDEYEVSLGSKSLDEVLEKVDFDGFKDNGSVTVRVKVNLAYLSTAGSGYLGLVVLTVICVSLIAILIVLGLLYKQTKPAEPEVYDGKAPEVSSVPVKHAYQPVQQYLVSTQWSCFCGEYSNTGRFCVRCGSPAPMLQIPATYQMPVQPVQPVQPVMPVQYAQPVYAPVQQYQAVTYQMPVQTVQPVQPVQNIQPVQYGQSVYAPAPVAAPAGIPLVYTYGPVRNGRGPMPDYRAKPKKPEPAPADPEFVEGMKNRIPAIGARYAAFCIVFLFVQLGVSLLLSLLVPDVVKQYKTSLSMGLIVLAVDLIGFPFIWLLMRGIPKVKIEQHKLKFSEWFRFLMISEALILAGSMVGNLIHSAITLPFSSNDLNQANSLMQNSNVLVRTLVVGIGAPVFEELIFRKVLIDRTVKYGEYLSIVMSGIMFGLLHGNFQQFFFAALIGMLFAYIYIRTGRIRYTIFLHMAINLSSSLVLQTLLSVMLEAEETGDYESPLVIVCTLVALAWAGGVMALGIIGIVKLIKGLKRKELALKMMKGEPRHKQVNSLLFKDRVFWLYIAATIVLFLNSYLPDIIAFFLNKQF